MNKQESVVDVLIKNISEDQKLLALLDKKVQEAKDEKKEVADRMKDYRRDVGVLMKYSNDSQREKFEKLGFDFNESDANINAIASFTLKKLMHAKDNQMTNGALYAAYVDTFKNKDDAFTYSEYNIKCRPLFNTQRVLRKKAPDSTNSRDDIISLNGKIKQEEGVPIGPKS